MEVIVLMRRSGTINGMDHIPVGTGSAPALLVHDATPRDFLDLRRDPDVDVVAPSMPLCLIEPTDRVIDSLAVEQTAWGVEAVGAADSPFDGRDVTVAVLDTGIDKSHPAFEGVEFIGRNFMPGELNDFSDTEGHGTHCAGTMFGRDVGGTRIGVARGISRAVIGKVVGPAGGSTAILASAIQWAVEQGARVISMSLGMDFVALRESLAAGGRHPLEATSSAMQVLIDNVRFFDRLGSLLKSGSAFGRSAVVVAAAGNKSGRTSACPYVLGAELPAETEDFISVGAIGRSSNAANPYRIAPFSNGGANVAAPGVGILSAVPGGGLESWTGTSMATPHVAGVAALWLQKLRASNSPAKASDVELKLFASCRLSPELSESDVGLGIPQAPSR